MKKSDAKCGYSLCPTRYFLQLFETVSGSSHIWFCREFQALFFHKKSVSIKGKIEKKS